VKFDTTILGEAWTIIIAPTETDHRLQNCDGFCDFTSRHIFVDDFSSVNDYQLDNKVRHILQNLRHEITHAFLFESGLCDNWQHPELGHEETVVDWIAAQYPKFRKVIDAAEARFIAAYVSIDEPDTVLFK
jgi:hypothetical protein